MANRSRRSCTPLQEDRILNLVKAAVNEMGRGEGVSRQKILEHVQKSCKGGKKVANAAKIAITKALEEGLLERTTGSGLNGSFRLPSDPNGCEVVSFTSRKELIVENTIITCERGRRGEKIVPNVISFNERGCTSAQYNEEFHLKAILKTPRSRKASGFRVKFNTMGPQICWISPLPHYKRHHRARRDVV